MSRPRKFILDSIDWRQSDAEICASFGCTVQTIDRYRPRKRFGKILAPLFGSKARGRRPRLSPPDAALWKAGLVLLAGLQAPRDDETLSRKLELPVEEIRPITLRLRAAGVWVDDKVSCEWDDEHGDISFILDCLIGVGQMQRVPADTVLDTTSPGQDTVLDTSPPFAKPHQTTPKKPRKKPRA